MGGGTPLGAVVKALATRVLALASAVGVLVGLVRVEDRGAGEATVKPEAKERPGP